MPKDTRSSSLSVRVGQCSSAGIKPFNQDFHGALVPDGRVLTLKGITVALADGISTSDHGAEAAETTVKSLLTDYYATPDTWTAKTAVSRVIAATNSWLCAQGGHAAIDDRDRGYVCTLAAIVLKARSAHLFHVGDSRIWRLSGDTLEPLTRDHRASFGAGETVLTRAMGVEHGVEIDYRQIGLTAGDVFLLTSDGVHGVWDARAVAKALRAGGEPDALAEQIVQDSLKAGSDDNLTVQIVFVDGLPPATETGFEDDARLPLLSSLSAGDAIDGYTILREIHANHRSKIYLARDRAGGKLALKIPASDMKENPDALRRFMMEEWIARRLASPHLLGAPSAERQRTALYAVTDFVEGQTLRQWMQDNPSPSLEDVRGIIEQIVKGLRVMHRREMLHQDLRPENVMIDRDGVVKLIDFGAAYVSGVQEAAPALEEGIQGTHQYAAPEYFSGEPVSWRSDLYSLGVIAYEMLTGVLPYGTQVGRIQSPRDRMRLKYRNARDDAHPMPLWVDEALARAVHADPARRYNALSEFVADLRRPSISYTSRHKTPLAARDPERFWKSVSGILAILCVILAMKALS